MVCVCVCVVVARRRGGDAGAVGDVSPKHSAGSCSAVKGKAAGPAGRRPHCLVRSLALRAACSEVRADSRTSVSTASASEQVAVRGFLRRAHCGHAAGAVGGGSHRTQHHRPHVSVATVVCSECAGMA